MSELSRLILATCGALNEPVMAALERDVRELRTQNRQLQNLIAMLTTPRACLTSVIHALLNLIGELDAMGHRNVDMLREHYVDYGGGVTIDWNEVWDDALEVDEVIYVLVQLGYRVLRFTDDVDAIMDIDWSETTPTEEDLALADERGWEYYMPSAAPHWVVESDNDAMVTDSE